MRKLSELLTIPAAIILLFAADWISEYFRLHVFTWEPVVKIFSATVLFLLALGLIRIIYIIMIPEMYRYFDPSFAENYKWKLFSGKEKAIAALFLFYVFSRLFGDILNGL